jgi:uncharacterized protein (DUF1697 family)
LIYVALLRGINVGGNNKIAMKELAAACEQKGMSRVTTYIQSGNIVFAYEGLTQDELRDLWEAMIKETFGLAIRVLILSLDQMRTIFQAIPDNWKNDSEMKSDVLFLWEEANDPSALDKLAITPGVDQVFYVNGAILWSVNKEDYIKSALNKLMATRLSKQMTVRNVNTTRKLYALMVEAEAP